MALCTLTLPCCAIENTVADGWWQNPRSWTPLVSTTLYDGVTAPPTLQISCCLNIKQEKRPGCIWQSDSNITQCCYPVTKISNNKWDCDTYNLPQMLIRLKQFYTEKKTAKNTCINIQTTLRAIPHLSGKLHLNRFTTRLHIYWPKRWTQTCCNTLINCQCFLSW